MPKLKMELGAEPRKVAILAGLLLLAAYLIYSNVFSGSDQGPSQSVERPSAAAAKTASSAAAADGAMDEAAGQVTPQRTKSASGRSDFKPSLKQRDRPDPMSIDPSLRLDVLEKIAAVTVGRVDRSLFDFGPTRREDQAKPAQPEPVIKVAQRMIGPEPPPPPPPPPVKPPPPPINLKFYGSSFPIRNGMKRVFCIDGDEIHTPKEGDVIKNRYRIVRINAASVVVEDLNYKNQQTLRIEEPDKTG